MEFFSVIFSWTGHFWPVTLPMWITFGNTGGTISTLGHDSCRMTHAAWVKYLSIRRRSKFFSRGSWFKLIKRYLTHRVFVFIVRFFCQKWLIYLSLDDIKIFDPRLLQKQNDIMQAINPWVKYLLIVLNQPSSKKNILVPPDRKILDPCPSVDMVPPIIHGLRKLPKASQESVDQDTKSVVQPTGALN